MDSNGAHADGKDTLRGAPLAKLPLGNATTGALRPRALHRRSTQIAASSAPSTRRWRSVIATWPGWSVGAAAVLTWTSARQRLIYAAPRRPSFFGRRNRF